MNNKDSCALCHSHTCLYRSICVCNGCVLDNQPTTKSSPGMKSSVDLTWFEFSTFDCSLFVRKILFAPRTHCQSCWVRFLLLFLVSQASINYIFLASGQSFRNSQHNNKVYSLKIIVISSSCLVSLKCFGHSFGSVCIYFVHIVRMGSALTFKKINCFWSSRCLVGVQNCRIMNKIKCSFSFSSQMTNL